MNLRIRCAKHNQVLKIFSSYDCEGETVIDVVPCPECAVEQGVQRTGFASLFCRHGIMGCVVCEQEKEAGIARR